MEIKLKIIGQTGSPEPASNIGTVSQSAHALCAPRPHDLASTGLSQPFLSELVLKHLYYASGLDVHNLSRRLGLAGSIVESVTDFLRHQALVEIRHGAQHGDMHFNLTERGRTQALEALAKSGYAGAAPVPLELYRRVTKEQSAASNSVSRQDVHSSYSDVVADSRLIDQLGVALNSKKAIFLYGPAGTGKTYLGRRLSRLLGDNVLIPQSILVGDTVVQYFDPVVHRPTEGNGKTPSHLIGQGHDPRFLECERPVIITGGELTLDMLEVKHDPMSKQYRAPQQLIANNGLLMIDDLGRQKMSVDMLLNRWIVPMEDHHDFLALGSGQRFEVPFDVVLVFSTNLNPLELADEAFLRRLGYKIRFRYSDPEEYNKIWRQFCAGAGVDYDEDIMDYVLELYEKDGRPMLPCHPRDLLSSVLDQHRYSGTSTKRPISREQIREAWATYFVPLE